MKAYTIEFKVDDSLPSKITSHFTNTGYSHTGGAFQDEHNNWYYAELDGWQKKPYTIRRIKSLDDFLKSNKKMVAFKLPYEFDDLEMFALKLWWLDKREKNYPYGWLKLTSFIFWKPLYNFALKHYEKTGKVFKPILGNWIKKEMVCSVAWDKSLKEACHYDCFPELDEDMIVPGCWANDNKFKRYRSKK